MRRVLPLLLIATPALADSEKLVLRPLEARALPHVAASDADCDAGVDFTPIAVTQKLDVRGAKFTAAHDCGLSDQSGYLAISRGDATYIARAGTVAYSGANMTAAPQHLSIERDAFSSGTFADGALAVVYRVDLRDANVCFKAGCGQDSVVHRQIIVACTVPTGLVPVPRCATATAVCDGDRCVAPVLDRGLLTTSSGAHRERHAID